MNDSLRVKVSSFDCAGISEALENYGFEGECTYVPGAKQGFFRAQGGRYNFLCDFTTGEVEIAELVIEIDGIIGSSLS